ncbi:tetratricopeptide repeat protein [Aliiroseovarius sp. Z3]|uniref:tetratricopeptide repeat protein n=1 Tax=Aliiroseovarius sp. Z3 TaxID=2811402 RepID=UPI0023B2C826|nr:tetratricopeptide repeat protein [Aliiroseovarius sp. Z3]MDE9449561.1 tetratricopeptide repeat protein [Aliiroseovarius sp. Z3]
MPFRSSASRQLVAAIAAAVCLAGFTPSATQADAAGPYLAARQADLSGDFAKVVEYGTRALVDNPERADVLEGLVVAHTAMGEVDKALPFARRLASINPDNQLAGLVLLGDALASENWDESIALLEGGVSVAGVVDQMITAWASLGQGRMSQALEIFDALSKDPNSRSFAQFQKALALAHVGDFEGAAGIFSGSEGEIQLNRGGILAYAQVLSQLDRHADALELMNANASPLVDPEVDDIIARLEAGEILPFTGITSPNDGIAELFYAVSESRSVDSDPTIALVFSRLAEYLNPRNAVSTLLSARLLERLERHELAVEAYGRVPKGNFLYQEAALGRTDVLRRSDKFDEAIEELSALADTYPDTLRFRVALGDTLMQLDRYEEARLAYDQAIAGFTEDLPGQWATYFQRAIALTKLDDWPAAEADFRKALELSPEEPNVLNYLGYTYVERRDNLDEALDMIERAVAARPDSGYIVDSLGWVFYRLGRYDDAVKQLERAVELIPVDPILNDHLGDAYWAVGRKREAEFQWSRAQSFVTDDTDLEEMNPDRVRRKLEVGLDVVLEEEGAAPLHPAE